MPKERVLDFEVTHRLVDGGAEVDYTVTTNGSHDVTVEVLDGTTKVAEASGKTGTLKITNAKLWNVHAAYLYNFVIRITDGHAVIDEYFDKIGIRTFEVKDGHFLLNGKPVYLRGFGKHEDSDIRGRGLDLATVKRDYELMKWIGANCFRTSHYPYAEELYQMADEEGFLIIDEVPAVGFMQSTMNFLAANQGNGKKVGYFEKETTPKLLENHKAALTDMITRDKNHASVIAWSILNEPQCTSEGTEAYFKPLFDLAHELDPQKRPPHLCHRDDEPAQQQQGPAVCGFHQPEPLLRLVCDGRHVHCGRRDGVPQRDGRLGTGFERPPDDLYRVRR